ncbi:MAG: hypothetical protein HFF08_10515 [Oscillospiraceae bacterium]|nr:hypothetical protein [Oscillospiraceae bacterium]
MNHDEMQLLAKAKEAILRRIEADVSKGRVTGFHLNCIHAVAEIEELERKEREAQGNCGDCVAFKAYIDGSETGQGTQLENVTRVDLPRGRENVIGIYEISKMSLTFKSLEDARITLEKQGELRRIEIREAIQYMDCVQRRIGLHAVKHVIMGRFLDFLQNPITYGGNRETTVRFVVSSYSVYGDGDEILWMEAEP